MLTSEFTLKLTRVRQTEIIEILRECGVSSACIRVRPHGLMILTTMESITAAKIADILVTQGVEFIHRIWGEQWGT